MQQLEACYGHFVGIFVQNIHEGIIRLSSFEEQRF